jgi:hypothetical protein
MAALVFPIISEFWSVVGGGETKSPRAGEPALIFGRGGCCTKRWIYGDNLSTRARQKLGHPSARGKEKFERGAKTFGEQNYKNMFTKLITKSCCSYLQYIYTTSSVPQKMSKVCSNLDVSVGALHHSEFMHISENRSITLCYKLGRKFRMSN